MKIIIAKNIQTQECMEIHIDDSRNRVSVEIDYLTDDRANAAIQKHIFDHTPWVLVFEKECLIDDSVTLFNENTGELITYPISQSPV